MGTLDRHDEAGRRETMAAHECDAAETQALDPGARTTRSYDVCGTIDELKRVLYEEPEAVVTRPEELESLVDDALFMIGRMEMRLTRVRALSRRGHGDSSGPSGDRRPTASGGQAGSGDAEAVAATREPSDRASARRRGGGRRGGPVRGSVASSLENVLYRYKDLALTLARAYRSVKGNRSWVVDEDEAHEAAALLGEREWARWLPPSPHRERIVHYLKAGRAHLMAASGKAAETARESPPLVQFGDGGVMPLPVVCWSPEVRNFHPAGSPPHPRGPLYRGPESARARDEAR